VTTDKLRSYGAAFRHLGLSCHHEQGQALSAYVLLALNQHVENLALIDGTPQVHRQLDDKGDTNHLNLSAADEFVDAIARSALAQ
jgi:hypothetical protein